MYAPLPVTVMTFQAKKPQPRHPSLGEDGGGGGGIGGALPASRWTGAAAVAEAAGFGVAMGGTGGGECCEGALFGVEGSLG